MTLRFWKHPACHLPRLLWPGALLLAAPSVQAQFDIKGAATNLLDARKAGASATVSGEAVTAIAVRGGGGGYITPPIVTIDAPPSGTTATAAAVISGGVVTGFNIVTPGTGYTTPPAVRIAPPFVLSQTTPQFAGQAVTSAASGPIGTGGVSSGRYPKAVDNTVPASPVVTAVLGKSIFGHGFAAGAPLYQMGDEIRRPSVRWDGTAVPLTYWRSQPVQPGEVFTPQGAGNIADPVTGAAVPQGSVTVTSSTLGGQAVTVSSPPSTLTSGALLLGATVATVSGNAVTLLTSANQAISSATTVSFTPYQPFYYSPRADKVFATQPGRVTITWVSVIPDTSKPGEVTPTYKFRQETFAVSGGTTNPVRPFFWTEKSFNSPIVQVPARIRRVNPVYNTYVPAAVANEYTVPGANEGNLGAPPETRTLWFDDTAVLPSIHAYNAEGRIFVEYLGNERPGSNGLRDFLGADVIEVKKEPDREVLTTYRGDEVLPRSTPLPGDDQLVPSLVSGVGGTLPPQGTFLRPDGTSRYFAERESLDPDAVTIHWLEGQDAAIHFLTAPAAPGLSLQWPKLKRSYRFTWPAAIAAYQPVNVIYHGAREESAMQFTAANLPTIVFQDNPGDKEARIDGTTQWVLVDIYSSADRTNRTLLKFTSTDGPWYVRLYIQSQNVPGSPAVAEVPDPDGSGPLTGTPARAAVYTLNDQNADGVADHVYAATVGTRLEPPPGGYETAGYIAAGDCYSTAAYKNPFTAGVAAAASGGIIPVNAIPGANTLTVWWLKRVAPGFTDKLAPIYVPAIAARYTVT